MVNIKKLLVRICSVASYCDWLISTLLMPPADPIQSLESIKNVFAFVPTALML
jgi:hypothetical protein